MEQRLEIEMDKITKLLNTTSIQQVDYWKTGRN